MKLIKKFLSCVVNATPLPVVLLKSALGGVGDRSRGVFDLRGCESLADIGSVEAPA